MIKLKYPSFWRKKGWISLLLIPFSRLYIFLGFIRRKFTKPIRLSQKIICVGNITVGGAGKTQLVAWLAEILNRKKISFVIITKGYKSELQGAKLVQITDKAQEVGDESILLRKYGPVIAAKKIKDALKLIDQINPHIIILDDGMQNPLLIKDIQILVFDSITMVGNNLIFPAGPLRETLNSGLTKADLIFIIGNSPTTNFNLINNINSAQKPCFKAAINLNGNLDKNIEYMAFAAIGNPEKFYSLLKQNNFKIKQQFTFEDHYNYTNNDLEKLINLARLNKCQLITTEKDYVKIPAQYKDAMICTNVSLEFEKEQECINLIYEKILQKN